MMDTSPSTQIVTVAPLRKQLPLDVLVEIAWMLALDMDYQAGWIMNEDEVPRPRLGWISMTHVNTHWRRSLIAVQGLWSKVLFAFPVDGWLEMILRRTRNIEMDFDLLLHSSRLWDISTFIYSVVDDWRLLSRATMIKCTLARGSGLVWRHNYESRLLNTGMWHLNVCESVCSNLKELILPVTEGELYEFPTVVSLTKFCAENAQTVSYMSPGHTRPRIDQCYTTLTKCTSDAEVDIRRALDFIAHNKSLTHLEFVDLRATYMLSADDMREDVEPMYFPNITHPRVVTYTLSSLDLFLDKIRTPHPWKIVTRAKHNEHLPFYVVKQLADYRFMVVAFSGRDLYFILSNTSPNIDAGGDRYSLPDLELAKKRHSEHNIHVEPSYIIFSGHDSLPSLLAHSPLSLDTIVVAPKDRRLRCQRFGVKHWWCCTAVTSLQNLILEDEDLVGEMTGALPCPRRIVLVCRGSLMGRTGVEVLITALDHWRERGMAPDEVIVRGYKRDADSSVLNTRGDLGVIDLRG